MAKQLAFYFNSDACTGCKACAIACKDRSDLPVGINWRRVYLYEGGNWLPGQRNIHGLVKPNNVYAYAVSISCMHCEDPLCVKGCPTGGMYKRDDGVVMIDEEKCIGCRYCNWACPYGATQFDEETGVMTKCDFCANLIDQGKNPVCVDACVMRALEFGELDELRKKYGKEAEIAPLPTADVTSPSFVVTPHRHAQPSKNGTGKISSVEEVQE